MGGGLMAGLLGGVAGLGKGVQMEQEAEQKERAERLPFYQMMAQYDPNGANYMMSKDPYFQDFLKNAPHATVANPGAQLNDQSLANAGPVPTSGDNMQGMQLQPQGPAGLDLTNNGQVQGGLSKMNLSPQASQDLAQATGQDAASKIAASDQQSADQAANDSQVADQQSGISDAVQAQPAQAEATTELPYANVLHSQPVPMGWGGLYNQETGQVIANPVSQEKADTARQSVANQIPLATVKGGFQVDASKVRGVDAADIHGKTAVTTQDMKDKTAEDVANIRAAAQKSVKQFQTNLKASGKLTEAQYMTNRRDIQQRMDAVQHDLTLSDGVRREELAAYKQMSDDLDTAWKSQNQGVTATPSPKQSTAPGVPDAKAIAGFADVVRSIHNPTPAKSSKK